MDLKDKILSLLRAPPWRYEHGRKINDEELVELLVDMCQEEMTDAIMHYVSELAYYQQRVEELEVDLMLAHESYQLNQREQANINPKRRTTF